MRDLVVLFLHLLTTGIHREWIRSRIGHADRYLHRRSDGGRVVTQRSTAWYSVRVTPAARRAFRPRAVRTHRNVTGSSETDWRRRGRTTPRSLVGVSADVRRRQVLGKTTVATTSRSAITSYASAVWLKGYVRPTSAFKLICPVSASRM
jgi:hypothetical protein